MRSSIHGYTTPDNRATLMVYEFSDNDAYNRYKSTAHSIARSTKMELPTRTLKSHLLTSILPHPENMNLENGSPGETRDLVMKSNQKAVTSGELYQDLLSHLVERMRSILIPISLISKPGVMFFTAAVVKNRQ
jgi:hypothetical protein